MRNAILLLIPALAALAFTFKENEDVYLFSYFKGNGEDGLHMAWSEDGYKWSVLHEDQPFLKPEVGESKLMRDPCIIQGPDKKFHMVWTAGWTERGIGYANSKDLVNWSEQLYIPVMQHEPAARNTWAPEITYDKKDKTYMIYWSTTIPGTFPETASEADNGYNHRIYYTLTRDFKTFSETKLLYDPGFNAIDATLIKKGDEYIMFLKDETREPPAKNIHVARSKSITGPYGQLTGPITDNWVEGPTAIKVGGQWVVYYDKYTRKEMGAVASKDLANWTDISSQLEFPQGMRHGTVFQVSRKVFEKIRDMK